MADAVTSESTDVNIISSNNSTTTEMVTRSLPKHVPVANQVTVRVFILLIMAVISLCGNGFTLATIRLTPRLWTKTNFILASMLVADIITGIFMFWYTPVLLFFYVFNNPCHYNVAIALTTWLYKLTGYVSIYHLILISVERYIAIVYPLHYESKFTDRTLKVIISAVWVSGLFLSVLFMMWLPNADLQQCVIIPKFYHLFDVGLFYVPVCITMIICYSKIFAISWRHRQRIDPTDTYPTRVISVHQTSAVTTALPTQSSSKSDNIEDPRHTRPSDSEPPTTSGATSSTLPADLAQQQRQKIKSRRREFKAVYLTAAITGTFIILWFPAQLARILTAVGYNPVVTNYLYLAGGAIGSFNFGFSWAIYAAASKSYRRAYRQMLIRIGCCCCKNITLQAAD